MYKYFAKTRFIGKKIEYLTQCHSTNEYLSDLIRRDASQTGLIVVAGYQTRGKGQRGNLWMSEPNQNLLFSIHMNADFLQLSRIYLLTVMSGLALQKCLKQIFPEEKVEIKWPNDIYINDKKVAGILTETILTGKSSKDVVVGIGLNVNQINFEHSGPTSLALIGHRNFDLADLLEKIALYIEETFDELKNQKIDHLVFQYHQVMRWRGEIHLFKSGDYFFNGEIIGLGKDGKLMVKHNDRLMGFDVKEIQFVE